MQGASLVRAEQSLPEPSVNLYAEQMRRPHDNRRKLT